MKKFLTVLLALSVVFTYTVGTAFAAAPTTGTTVDTRAAAEKVITDKADEFDASIDTDLAKLIKDNANGKVITNIATVSPEAIAKVLGEKATEAKTALLTQKVNALNELETQVVLEKAANKDGEILGYVIKNPVTDLDAGYVDVTLALAKLADPEFYDKCSESEDDVLKLEYVKAEFALRKAAVLAYIKAMDLSVYSTEADTDKDGINDYNEATAAVKVALDEIEAIKLVDNADLNAAGTALYRLGLVCKIEYKGTTDETISGSLATILNELKKVSVEESDKTLIENAKTKTIALMKKVLAEAKDTTIETLNDKIFAENLKDTPNVDKIVEYKEQIADVEAQYDAAIEVLTYKYNNYDYKVTLASDGKSKNVFAYYDDKNVTGVGTYATDNTLTLTNKTTADFLKLINATGKTAGLESAEAIVDYVADLKDNADEMKAEIDVDGDMLTWIDQQVEEYTHKAYMAGDIKNELFGVPVSYEVYARVEQLLHSDKKVKVDGKEYKSVDNWVGTTIYEESKAEEVEAIIEAIKEELKTCKTAAEADAAFVAAFERFDAVPTAEEQAAQFAYGGSLYKADTKYAAELEAYINYKLALIDGEPADAANALYAYWNDLSDVYSQADIDAKLAKAKDAVDNIKTVEALDAEAKALTEKVLAVKVPVTAAAKEGIVQLYKDIVAFDDYAEMVGYTKLVDNTLVTKYVTDLSNIEKDAMDDIVKAINKDGKVTIDEKAQVEELRALVDAHNDLYVEELELDTLKYAEETVEGFEDAIFALEVKAAIKLVNALATDPVNAEAVAAARAAVDALGYDGIIALLSTNPGNEALEKLVVLEQKVAYNAIKAVESLKVVKNHSVAGKGYIKIAWSVKGDAAAADGYQIYRATKANGKYTKFFTTSKMTYKNTKSLKKGTKYYYKVRAYKTVDGVKYYSDWSNKAYRVAK